LERVKIRKALNVEKVTGRLSSQCQEGNACGTLPQRGDRGRVGKRPNMLMMETNGDVTAGIVMAWLEQA
jgi:hypothetical protein